MSQGLSLYLDVVRFLAALIVFMSHASGQLFTGGLLWQTGPYQRSAVIVFFVLSGFVISLVLSTKEQDAFSYAKQRIARLYSVVIPAMVLTFVCDSIGLSVNPGFYYGGPWGYAGNQPLHYLASFFFLNQTWWHPDLGPGINVPFWSLCFEACYYWFIGLLWFSTGIFRIVSIAILALVAGPSIIGLLPAWGLGFLLHRYGFGLARSRVVGLLCIGAGIGLLVLSPAFRAHFPNLPFGIRVSNCEPGDYFDAFAFALQLFGFMAWQGLLLRILLPFAGVIRFLGSLTFALYLFHRPLIQLFAVLPLDVPSSWLQRVYLLGGTVLIVATFGRVCERWKGTISMNLEKLRHRVQWKPT